MDRSGNLIRRKIHSDALLQRYSHPIVSQKQSKPGGTKNAFCSSNRKKSKCHLSRIVTDSYVDMGIQQPDISNNRRLCQAIYEHTSPFTLCRVSLFVVFFGPVDDHGLRL